MAGHVFFGSLFLVVAAAGCSFPSPPLIDAADGFVVRGDVDGMWNGAAVTLRLTSSAGSPEIVTITTNRDFAFDAVLRSGATYNVTVDTDPANHLCTVENGEGTIAAADAANIHVRCVAQVALEIAPTAPVSWAFDIGTTTYMVDCGLGCQETRIVVSAPAATTRRVNGMAVADGVASAPIALAPGPNTITVDVVLGALSQQYTIQVNRAEVSVSPVAYGKASNGDAADGFAAAVAADRDHLVVGAPGEDSNAGDVNQDQTNNLAPDAGAAYVFRRAPGTLAWTQSAYLKGRNSAGGGAAGDRFGEAVDVMGDFVVVGAPGDDYIVGDSGAAYVFRRSGNAWLFETKLKRGSPVAGDGFGASVAITEVGGTVEIAVGAPQSAGGGPDRSGTVFVFRRSGSLWSEVQAIKAFNAGYDDRFGTRVALAGDLLAVSAILEDGDGAGVDPPSSDNIDDAGAVYLYRRGGTWTHEAYLKAIDPDEDQFGAALDVDVDQVIVGAPYKNSSTQLDLGAAYLYRRSGGSWSHERKFESPAPMELASFGSAVAIRGDMLLIGEDQAASQTGPGTVHVGRRDGGAWTLVPVSAPTIGPRDRFGRTAGLSGEAIFIGAPAEDGNGRGFDGDPGDNTIADSGAVYGYY